MIEGSSKCSLFSSQVVIDEKRKIKKGKVEVEVERLNHLNHELGSVRSQLTITKSSFSERRMKFIDKPESQVQSKLIPKSKRANHGPPTQPNQKCLDRGSQYAMTSVRKVFHVPTPKSFYFESMFSFKIPNSLACP